MTGHLDLDALADLAARDGGVRAVGPHESHLAECDTCRARLDALRDRSAVVATRLAEGADRPTPPAMPAAVNERITAALAAAGAGEGAQTAGPAVASRRRRWSTRLAVAATVLVIGGAAVPVAVHLDSRPSGSAESTAASAADAAAGASVSAGTAGPQSPTELSSAAFGVDVRALLARPVVGICARQAAGGGRRRGIGVPARGHQRRPAPRARRLDRWPGVGPPDHRGHRGRPTRRPDGGGRRRSASGRRGRRLPGRHAGGARSHPPVRHACCSLRHPTWAVSHPPA